MSAGPLTAYTGVSGVADDGGNSLTDDLNVFYSVRTAYRPGASLPAANTAPLRSPAISPGC